MDPKLSRIIEKRNRLVLGHCPEIHQKLEGTAGLIKFEDSPPGPGVYPAFRIKEDIPYISLITVNFIIYEAVRFLIETVDAMSGSDPDVPFRIRRKRIDAVR